MTHNSETEQTDDLLDYDGDEMDRLFSDIEEQSGRVRRGDLHGGE